MTTGDVHPSNLYYPIQPRQGWVCPRCNAVHSPDVLQCFCVGPYPQPYTVTYGASSGNTNQDQ